MPCRSRTACLKPLSVALTDLFLLWAEAAAPDGGVEIVLREVETGSTDAGGVGIGGVFEFSSLFRDAMVGFKYCGVFGGILDR